MIADECPAASNLSGGPNCGQCNTSDKNTMGQSYNFDIAVDAMNTDQYNTFYNGVTGGRFVLFPLLIGGFNGVNKRSDG